MTANLDGNKDELCSASTPFVSVSWFLLLLLLLLLRASRQIEPITSLSVSSSRPTTIQKFKKTPRNTGFRHLLAIQITADFSTAN